MTIYIPEFWVGVLATLLLEAAALFAIALYNTIKKNESR